MRFLFVTDNLYPDTNASTEIVYRIAEELYQKYNAQISIIGFHSRHFDKDLSHFQTIPVQEVDEYNRFIITHNSKISRILGTFAQPSILLRRYLLFKENNISYWTYLYKKTIQTALRMDKYDAVIAVSMPLYSILPFASIKDTPPLYLYLLDPLSTHARVKNNKKLLSKIEEIDNKALGLFVTNIIYEETKGVVSEQNRDKMRVLEFPNIVPNHSEPKTKVALNRSHSQIHAFFCGQFYQDIRNPDYTFALFEKLKQYNIVLHIVGHNRVDAIIPRECSDNIVFHGRVSGEKALDFIRNADILVNIGNANTNQVPSKLLTYIATGKPILNVAKTQACPTLHYLQNYPLSLTLFEKEGIADSLIHKVQTFISQNSDKRLPFEYINDKYFTCTPEYVTKELLNTILKSINHKEN